MDPIDDALSRLNAQRQAEGTVASQRQWANEQAHKLVQRYVQSLQKGGIKPLRLNARTYTRHDWTEKVGGLFSGRRVDKHQWDYQDRDAGTGYLVKIGTAAAVEKGQFIPGNDSGNPEISVPLAVLYHPEADDLVLGVLLEKRGFNVSSREGEDFAFAQGARVATLAPTFVGRECDLANEWGGPCGYPLWKMRMGLDPLSYLGVRGTWYEEVPYGSSIEHAPPSGQGTDAFQHYNGPVVSTLDHQLQAQGLPWAD